MTENKSSFFAIVKNPGNRIRRLPLTQETQSNLSSIFSETLSEFQNKEDVNYRENYLYRPNNEEIFVIKDFDDVEGLLRSIANPIEYQLLENEDIIESRAIYASVKSEGEEIIVIQGFNVSKIITPSKHLLVFSNKTFEELKSSAITIDKGITATYNSKKELRFFSFAKVKQIFDMADYVNAATDDIIKKFKEHILIDCSNVDESIFEDQNIRKKISSIMQGNVLDSQIERIVLSANDLEVAIDTTENKNKIVLPNNKGDLKNILRFLDDDYWQSSLSEQKYLTNSKRKI